MFGPLSCTLSLKGIARESPLLEKLLDRVEVHLNAYWMTGRSLQGSVTRNDEVGSSGEYPVPWGKPSAHTSDLHKHDIDLCSMSANWALIANPLAKMPSGF